MEEQVYAKIIEILTRLERKMDAVADDVAEIKAKVNDDTPQFSQMYGGVVND